MFELPRTCPHCQTVVDAHTALDGLRAPADGDLSICWYCAKPSILEGRGLRLLTAEELRNPEITSKALAIGISITRFRAGRP